MMEIKVITLTVEQLDKIVEDACLRAVTMCRQAAQPKYYDTKEALEVLKCGKTFFFAMINEGLVHPIKIGAKNKYNRDEIDSLVNRNIKLHK